MSVGRAGRADTGGVEHLIALRDSHLRDAPAELVPVDSLVVGYSPRSAGEDAGYARALAQVEADLPPIVVHRGSMRVIDGVHRLRAARLNGRRRIAVRFFDGADADASLLAVALNVAHGLPLSQAERAAAAMEIFASRPHWSDRAVATVAGLSARKVAQIRHRANVAVGDGHRLGRDGRVRPLNAAHGRELAGELLRADPDASLRKIGKLAGIAPATVADVRDRLRRGEHPVPRRQREGAGGDGPRLRLAAAGAEAPGSGAPVGHIGRDAARPGRGPAAPPAVRTSAELLRIFDSLRRDPSLRFNETGRLMLRVLDAGGVLAWDRERISAHLPSHCRDRISKLAQAYALVWQQFAEELRQDAQPGPQAAPARRVAG
jgi:hypothetical protein